MNARGCRILVVEDDRPVARLIQSWLGKEGWESETAHTAEEALGCFARSSPGLVLLDVGLPDSDGFEVCRAIRGKAGDEVPVLFVTAQGDVASRLKGFEAGGHDYIPKPIVREELLARVRAHLRLHDKQAELVERNRELEVEERMRQDTVDMIVHDLKVPLTAIRGSLSMAREAGLVDPKTLDRLVGLSQHAAETMLLLVNDILDVSRAEKDGLAPELSEFRLSELLENLGRFFTSSEDLGLVEIRADGAAEQGPLLTDRSMLVRILANLLTNALKFSTKKVELTVEPAGTGRLLFSVWDRGPGVPEGARERIFEKDVQLGGLGKEKGRGIGLRFCRLASEALGGRVWVESREGGGSRFCLDLPLRRSDS